MWVGILAAIVITVLFFSVGRNKKTPWHTKENENTSNYPGIDGDN